MRMNGVGGRATAERSAASGRSRSSSPSHPSGHQLSYPLRHLSLGHLSLNRRSGRNGYERKRGRASDQSFVSFSFSSITRSPPRFTLIRPSPSGREMPRNHPPLSCPIAPSAAGERAGAKRRSWPSATRSRSRPAEGKMEDRRWVSVGSD